MCLNPILIKNNKKGVISPYRDKRYMTVSCGHCPQCLENQRQGYITRATLEYEHCLKNQGFGYFVTLTWDNSFLPICNQLSFDKDTDFLKCDDVPVFNKKDLDDYIKNVRIQLERKLGWYKPLSFLCVSEYGAESKRPHLHIIFFHEYKLKSFIEQATYERIILDSWKYGNAVPSKKNRGYLEDSSAIRYLLKYVGKDTAFQHEYDLLVKSCTSIPVADVKQLYNKYKGFVKCSKSLGLCYLDSITDDDFINGKINYSADTILFIPNYYYRHKFYDKKKIIMPSGKEMIRYEINAEGIKFNLKRFDYRQNKSRKDYLNILDTLIKGFDPHTTDKLKLLNQLQKTKYFSTEYDVYNYFKQEFPNAEYYFRYTNIFRGCFNHDVPDFTDYVRDIPSLDLYLFTTAFDYCDETKDFVLGDYSFAEYAHYINNYLSVHELGHELALLIVKLLKLNAYELKKVEFQQECRKLNDSLTAYWKKQTFKNKY